VSTQDKTTALSAAERRARRDRMEQVLDQLQDTSRPGWELERLLPAVERGAASQEFIDALQERIARWSRPPVRTRAEYEDALYSYTRLWRLAAALSGQLAELTTLMKRDLVEGESASWWAESE
jgi:hypothetical protein